MPVDGAEVVQEMSVILGELTKQLAIERVRLRHCVVAEGGTDGAVSPVPDPGYRDDSRPPTI